MTMRCAIMGSGNIGTDLMIKLRRSELLDLVALVGIDPASDGLARARALGVQAPHTGIDWVREHAAEIDLVFDATGGMWVTDFGKVEERRRDRVGVYYGRPARSLI